MYNLLYNLDFSLLFLSEMNCQYSGLFCLTVTKLLNDNCGFIINTMNDFLDYICISIYNYRCLKKERKKDFTYCSFSSLHSGSSSSSESSFTPKSPSSFQLRFSSLRCEGFDFRAEDRAIQPCSLILQFSSLHRVKNQRKKKSKVLLITFYCTATFLLGCNSATHFATKPPHNTYTIL